MKSRSNLANVAIGLATAAFLLLLVEAGARVAKTVADDFSSRTEDSRAPGLVVSPEYGWTLQPGFRGIAEETQLREYDQDGYRAVDTSQVADADNAKIVFIGDSNTFGYEVAEGDSFVEVVDRLLPSIDAINLGVPGYSSCQGLLVAKSQLPKLRPKLAVFSFNFNDRRYVFNASQVDCPAKFAAMNQIYGSYLPDSSQNTLEYCYLYRGLRRVFRVVGLVPDEPTSLVEVNLNELMPRVDELAYRKNLTEFATFCRSVAVRPVFIVLRDNPANSKRLSSGIERLASGDIDGAIQELNVALSHGDALSDLIRIELAKAYRRIGNAEREAELQRSKCATYILDGENPVRLDTDYNRIMREVAEANDVELIDAATVLEQTPEVFIDTCHFNQAGHRRVGQLIAERIARLVEENHREKQ